MYFWKTIWDIRFHGNYGWKKDSVNVHIHLARHMLSSKTTMYSIYLYYILYIVFKRSRAHGTYPWGMCVASCARLYIILNCMILILCVCMSSHSKAEINIESTRSGVQFPLFQHYRHTQSMCTELCAILQRRALYYTRAPNISLSLLAPVPSHSMEFVLGWRELLQRSSNSSAHTSSSTTIHNVNRLAGTTPIRYICSSVCRICAAGKRASTRTDYVG